MNDNEKIQRAEQLIAEANALLSDVKTVHDSEKDVITKYKENYCKDRKYFLNSLSEIGYIKNGDSFEETKTAESPYQYYLTKELAEYAKELKDFNDKLLAFKYCYDLDYKPVSGTYGNRAYFVYYGSEDDKYCCDFDVLCNRNTVHFSSEEIAQKCCDWLNSLKE